MSALVLDGDTRAALAITRALGRAGVPVMVAAPGRRSLAGASRHASARVVLPDPLRLPDAFGAALVERSRRTPGEIWFPVTDASLAVVSEVRAELGDVILPIPDGRVLELAWDKSRLLETAASAGVPGPRTHRPQDIDEVRRLAPGLEYPVVLKPRRSRWRTAQGFREGEVSYVGDAAALPAAWQAQHERVPLPLIQERIPGHGMGVFVLADRGRVVARFAHRRLREKPPSGGVSVLRESIPVPERVAAPAARLIEALAWHGVCMIEFRVDARDGTPYLMEINPRFWGSLQLAIDAGVDFPLLLYRQARGDAPPPATGYRTGVRSRWLLGDLDHLLIRLRRAAGGAGELPPHAPGLWRAVLAFLDPWAGRLEVMRRADPGPGWYELRAYVRNLLVGSAAGGDDTPATARGERPGTAMVQNAGDDLRTGRTDRTGRTLRGAIHVHSTISYDGRQTVAELARFFRARGLDFVCLSEHSDGLGRRELERLADEAGRESSDGFLMVPGIEFSCRRRLHILGLGVVEPVDSDDPLVVADHIRARGGVAIVAHPLAYGTDYPDALAERVDGVEIWNITKDGWLGPGAGALELWRAWRHRNPALRGFGALDLHAFDGPTTLEIEIDVHESTPTGILAALRSGPIRARGRYLSVSGVAPPAGLEALRFTAASGLYLGLRRWRDRLARRGGSGGGGAVPGAPTVGTAPRVAPGVARGRAGGLEAPPAGRRRHVLQLIETGGPGGAERVLVSLAEQLDHARDTRASVGLLRRGWLASELEGRGLDTHILTLAHALDLGFLARLTRLLRTEAVELVHAHEFAMNLYGALAGRLAGVPVVATVHGRNYYADARRRIVAMRLLPVLGASVVAVSADIRGFLEGELGVRGVRVIPNGVDVGRYTTGSRAAARRALGIDDAAVVVGAVGNLYRVKGHATLIEAVAKLDDARVHVVIAGRGGEETALREQAAAAGLGERLHLLGFREDVPALLPGFDVYALPSLSEGQSLALIEAMAAGLPIVASRVGGNPELIDHERHGLLVEAGAAAAWAAALGRLIASPETGRRLAAAARARARQDLSLEAMVARYRQLYAERGLEVAR